MMYCSNLFRLSCSLLLATAPLIVPPYAAGDWPQFQGPTRDGTSPETGLLRDWPAEGPTVLWSQRLHEGFGGPAIQGGEVFVLDREDSQRDVLRCVSLADGAAIWQVSYHASGSTSYDGSRTTPTVTDTHVFTVGLMGQFTCYSRAKQTVTWQIDLQETFHQPHPTWGFAQSPVLYEDLVIVAPQSPEGFVAAFRQDTGARVWTSEGLGSEGYSSPLITRLAGVDQVVMISAPGKGPGTVNGLSVRDGRTLWSYNGWKCRIPIPNATPVSDDRLFITGEYGAGSAMIRIARKDTQYSVKELFTTDSCESQIHQPLVIDGFIYANSNGNKRADGMICMSTDGELLWRTRDNRELPQFERGNLIYADGMILNLDGRTGILHLISPSPSGYVELARAPVFDGQKMWAPMALSDGKLVLRSQETMTCLDLRNP